MAIQDINRRNVTLFPLSVFFIACCYIGILDKNFAFLPILIFVLIGLITKTQAFGAADYIVVIAVSFLITDEQSQFFILLCGVCGIITALIFEKQKFPFIPAILLASAIAYLLRQ